MRALALLLLVALCGCPSPTPSPPPAPPTTPTPALDALDPAPPVTEADRPLAGAFRALDGAWEGTFTVYADGRGQQAGPRPTQLDPEVLARPPYQVELALRVRQDYASESPYFQRVTIRDSYPDGREVVSQGVNKVQGGELVCVVRKPDDLVVHQGTLPAPDTIIWQRARKEPQAIEWFRETVAADSYRIVGWGYYPGDDPAKAPRLFFHAEDRRMD